MQFTYIYKVDSPEIEKYLKTKTITSITLDIKFNLSKYLPETKLLPEEGGELFIEHIYITHIDIKTHRIFYVVPEVLDDWSILDMKHIEDACFNFHKEQCDEAQSNL